MGVSFMGDFRESKSKIPLRVCARATRPSSLHLLLHRISVNRASEAVIDSDRGRTRPGVQGDRYAEVGMWMYIRGGHNSHFT